MHHYKLKQKDLAAQSYQKFSINGINNNTEINVILRSKFNLTNKKIIIAESNNIKKTYNMAHTIGAAIKDNL